MTDFASCCVLSYQRPQFLRTAVSTMMTAGAPFELIVHDDGSADEELLDLLVDYQRAGVISTLILNPPGHNQGQGIALNRMFSMARGDPIIKLDQDLIFNEGWLARVNDILNVNAQHSLPIDGLVPHPGHMVSEPRIGLLGLFHYLHDPVDSRQTVISRFHHHGWEQHTHICGSAFALTRDAWEALGPFDEHSEAFAEDWTMQQAVTASEFAVCALPTEDLVSNQGFGVGPSTVVVDHGVVQTIHKEPLVHGRAQA